MAFLYGFPGISALKPHLLVKFSIIEIRDVLFSQICYALMLAQKLGLENYLP